MTKNPTRHVTERLRGKHGPGQPTRVLVARDAVTRRSFRRRRLAVPLVVTRLDADEVVGPVDRSVRAAEHDLTVRRQPIKSVTGTRNRCGVRPPRSPHFWPSRQAGVRRSRPSAIGARQRRHERASGFGYGKIADRPLAEVTPRSLDTPKPSRDIGHGSHRCEAPLLAAWEVGHCWTHGSLD